MLSGLDQASALDPASTFEVAFRFVAAPVLRVHLTRAFVCLAELRADGCYDPGGGVVDV